MQGCNSFLAGHPTRSGTRYRALDETAVFGRACRHGFPKKFLNLKHGERSSAYYTLQMLLLVWLSKMTYATFSMCISNSVNTLMSYRIAYGTWILKSLQEEVGQKRIKVKLIICMYSSVQYM